MRKTVRKGPFEVPPISKENGCRFYDYKCLDTKVAVRKVISMMNFSPLSPKTIARIARGAVSISIKQNHFFNPDGWSNYYGIRVTYPNGYGASITFVPDEDDEDCWEVDLLKDDELWSDDDGCDCTWSYRTEEEMIELCDHIYFM